ncbi:MAG: tRNA lysidine(34) synthetase TilS [Proteobacteria bacterium]|nr:tRNA lysidine(34) synthetase TilS [Pseudomonadota bacterium]
MINSLKSVIDEIFQNFFPFFLDNNLKKIAVAVSGGPDSLALCLILDAWGKENNKQIFALTVDHKLRPESEEEAKKVAKWLNSYSINHSILTWDHPPLQSKIQEQARDARYALMENFCKQEGIPVLCIAHHLEDQFETFMMRLSKGSGIQGLSCMQPIVERNGIFIVRPFLSVLPEDLKAYLQSIHQEYISDPSNDNESFERIRFRKALQPLIKNGFSLDLFNKSIQQLQDTNEWINECVEDAIFDIVEETEEGTTIIDVPAFLQLSPTLAIKLFRHILKITSDTPYPFSYDKVKDIVANIFKGSFKDQSAGGCVISQKKNKLYFKKDPRV